MLKVDKVDISFFVNCRYVGYWFGKNWLSELLLDLEVFFNFLGF